MQEGFVSSVMAVELRGEGERERGERGERGGGGGGGEGGGQSVSLSEPAVSELT